jgi:hypothetical protein
MILSLGYKSEAIKGYFGNALDGMNIFYSQCGQINTLNSDPNRKRLFMLRPNTDYLGDNKR